MILRQTLRQLANHKYEKEQKIYFAIICLIISTAAIYWIVISSCKSKSNDRYQRISLDLKSIDTIQLDNDAELARQHNENCSFWDCFNVYRCGDKLGVYVYPLIDYVDADISDKNSKEASSTISVLSKEFSEILKSILESPYYTSDPKEACILIPSIDILNLNRINNDIVAKALQALPQWENGENHLLFNVVPRPEGIATLRSDRAIIAGADFDSWNYRTGFDFAIPFLGFNKEDYLKDTAVTNQRPFWLVASILNLNDNQKTALTDIASKSNKNILLLDKCNKKLLKNKVVPPTARCAYSTTNMMDYKTAFTQGVFCIIAETERLFQINLIEALAANCIPVIYADNVVLPFSEIIDWTLAVLPIREADIGTIDAKLELVSPEKCEELRKQGEWLYDTYFATTNKIVLTVLAELNDRIFAYKAKNFIEWNTPNARSFQNPLFLSRVAQKAQGFTAVILTYDRVESLFKLIQKLSVVSSLQKILVIWNNEKEAPPHPTIFPKITKPLKVIRTKANKLSNRFYPYEEIETEAILTIDDDIVMLTADELDFGYEVWREFPDRIVGFPSRTHVWENDTMRWRYESEWTNQISMVLTGAAFHHKYWSYAYTNEMPGDIKDWVDEHMNCEDIAMNFLVANFTKKPPIKVAPRKKFKCPECIHTEMLSADLNHMMERSSCIDKFSKIYGVMPLKTVEFRADPVLYKDNFPEKLKRFNDVGSL